MKKQFAKKLVLNKTTISDLNTMEMNQLRGGLTTILDTCNTQDDCTRPKYCETLNRGCGTGYATQGCNSMTDCPSEWCEGW